MSVAPTVANPIPDQTWWPNGYFTFQFSASAFFDPDSPLTYDAALSNGDPLPNWLTFDSTTRTFEGTRPRDDGHTDGMQIQVTASDGESDVSDIFNLVPGFDWNYPFVLTPNADVLKFGDAGFIVVSLGGNDVITGGRGNDTFYGGDGDDFLDGGFGQDLMHGDNGNDFLTGTGDLKLAYGDAGNDQLFFAGAENALFGSEGNDWLGVSGDHNALAGGAGNDWIGATGASNTLAGQDDNDSLFSVGTLSYLDGGDGNDWVGVSGDNNTLIGGTGNDYVAATGSFNSLDGGAGNDHLVVAQHAGATFVFHLGYQQDDITGFAAHVTGGSDQIDLRGYGLTFGNLINLYAMQMGADCVIDFKNGDVLTLHDVQKSGLRAGDFVL